LPLFGNPHMIARRAASDMVLLPFGARRSDIQLDLSFAWSPNVHPVA
jgi:hypothetical protein